MYYEAEAERRLEEALEARERLEERLSELYEGLTVRIDEAQGEGLRALKELKGLIERLFKLEELYALRFKEEEEERA